MKFMLCGYKFDKFFLFEIVMPVYHYSVQTVCKCYHQTSKRKQLPFHELSRLLLVIIMILLVLKNIINILSHGQNRLSMIFERSHYPIPILPNLSPSPATKKCF